MRYRTLYIALLMCAGLVPAIAAAQANPSPDQRKMLDLLNRERRAEGLPALQWDQHLAQSARTHALLMVAQNDLSHQLPGEADLSVRVGVTGLRFTATAENLALAPTVDTAHDGLMKSPHHRENIMNGEYNSVGISIVPGGGELYFVQNFARVVPTYSEAQFRDAIVSAVNKARRAERLRSLEIQEDGRLHKAACSGSPNPDVLIHQLTGVSELMAFTSSSPDVLPPNLKQIVENRDMQRLDIGVCFKPRQQNGFASFWVVAAFYGEQASR